MIASWGEVFGFRFGNHFEVWSADENCPHAVYLTLGQMHRHNFRCVILGLIATYWVSTPARSEATADEAWKVLDSIFQQRWVGYPAPVEGQLSPEQQESFPRLITESFAFMRLFPEDRRCTWVLQNLEDALARIAGTHSELYRQYSDNLRTALVQATEEPLKTNLSLASLAIAIRAGDHGQLAEIQGKLEQLDSRIDLTHDHRRVVTELMVRYGASVLPHYPDKGREWLLRLRERGDANVRDDIAQIIKFEELRHAPVAIKFTALDGRMVDLSAMRGKVILLEFSGITWCPPCRREEPFLKAAYERYHRAGLEIVTITYESDEQKRNAVLRHIHENNLSWSYYFDGKGNQTPLIREFGVRGVPLSLFFDTNGLLVSTEARGPRIESLVRRYLGL